MAKGGQENFGFCQDTGNESHHQGPTGDGDTAQFSIAGIQGKTRHIQAKQVIYREDELAGKAYLIVSGMVKLLSHLPNGRARIVRLHCHSHWLGLEGLIGRQYEHTAVAVDEVEVACVSMSNLQHLEITSPQQYCRILKQGYQQLTQADRWIADFSTGGIKARVARLIDFLSKFEYGDTTNRVNLMTVHEMADMLGVTPESVSRILAEFKRNDMLHRIESGLHEFYEIDAKRLQFEARQ